MQNNSIPLTALFVAAMLAQAGCGAKGDPEPARRHPAAACAARPIGIRAIEVALPTKDTQGNRLSALESVKIYYLSLGAKRPSALEVFQQGEAILERRRPDLPAPGKAVTLDLSHFGRPPGWLVAVPFRAGGIPGAPSRVLPWIGPSY